MQYITLHELQTGKTKKKSAHIAQDCSATNVHPLRRMSVAPLCVNDAWQQGSFGQTRSHATVSLGAQRGSMISLRGLSRGTWRVVLSTRSRTVATAETRSSRGSGSSARPRSEGRRWPDGLAVSTRSRSRRPLRSPPEPPAGPTDCRYGTGSWAYATKVQPTCNTRVAEWCNCANRRRGWRQSAQGTSVMCGDQRLGKRREYRCERALRTVTTAERAKPVRSTPFQPKCAPSPTGSSA